MPEALGGGESNPPSPGAFCFSGRGSHRGAPAKSTGRGRHPRKRRFGTVESRDRHRGGDMAKVGSASPVGLGPVGLLPAKLTGRRPQTTWERRLKSDLTFK